MPEISRFFEALYTHFLLRDVVAKVVPGIVAALAVLVSVVPQSVQFLGVVLQVPVLVVVALLYGVGLMFGVFLQYAGSSSRIIKVHVWKGEGATNRVASIEKDIEFHEIANADPQYLRKRERLAILKEMAGNWAIGIFITTIAVAPRLVVSSAATLRANLLGFVVPIAIGVILVLQNRSLASEQQEWEMLVVNRKLGGGTSRSDSSAA